MIVENRYASMSKLKQDQVINRVLVDILSSEQRLPNDISVKDFFLVLDNKLVIHLMPYGLRIVAQVPSSANLERNKDVKRCLKRKITSVITDSSFYHPACDDDDLRNPPYDDVYIILDHAIWMANRFFENGENSLTVESSIELYNLSEHYFDYWTRDEINLKKVIR